MRGIGIWIVGVGLTVACSKSDTSKKQPPSEPGDDSAATKKAAPADKTVAEPSGPATIIGPPDDINVDPCGLITDEEVAELTGEPPKKRKREQTVKGLIGARPEMVVTTCNKGRVEILVGGRGVKPRNYKDVASIAGVGDEAKRVEDRGNVDRAWVKVGDRVAVAGPTPKITRGGDAAAKKERKMIEKVARLVADRLADLPAYEHRKGDHVGGPAVDPCELLEPADVARVTGPVKVLQLSSSVTGYPEKMARLERVSCSWHSTRDGSRVRVAFRRPVAFEKAGTHSNPMPAGPEIDGAPTKLGESLSLGNEIVIDKGEYALAIEVGLENEKKDAASSVLKALAEKAVSRVD